MTNKETNEKTHTTMENVTNFNSETHKTHFITIIKDLYEIVLTILGRACIVDNTNANFKKARLLNMPYVECCNHKFNLDIKSIIEKKSLDNTITDIKNIMIQTK